MKVIWIRIKWIINQAKPIVPFLAIVIIIGIITSVCNIYRALLMKNFIDSAIGAHKNQMIKYLIFLIAFVIIDIIFNGLVSLISTRNSLTLTNAIQKRVYKHLTNTSWLQFSKYHSGDILTRMTSDVDAITNVIVDIVPSMISLIALLFCSFITLLFFTPLLAIVALLIAPITVLLSRIYGSKIKLLYLKGQELESSYRSFLNETIQNIIIIKTFNLEEKGVLQVSKIQNDRLKVGLSRSKVGVLSNSTFSISSWLGFFIVMAWGGFNIANGIITYGTLSALISLFGNIQVPVSGLASSLPKLISAIASSERLMELEKAPTDYCCIDIPDTPSAGIQLKDISFSYNKLNNVFENVSLTINPGEITALIGPSGEGKTTLIRILLALLSAQNGQAYITYDNTKYQVSASTRKLVSYVPQGNTLFSGTIADNLRYGCPNASDEEIENAARLSCALDFIKSLPEGINTVIGEHGIGLSEGQAQRLAIGRALLRKAPILILDEATSALDSNTEVQVLKNINTLTHKPTCVIITHRLSVLEICSRVFRLENGKIEELHSKISNAAAIDAV